MLLSLRSSTLVGTTDTPCSVEDQPDVTDEDIELIFAEVNKFMDKPITKDEILAVWSGIRPLVREVNVT